MDLKAKLSPLAFASVFVFLGILWFLGIDQIISGSITDPEVARTWQVMSEILFIALTGTILWFLISRYRAREDKKKKQLKSALREKEVLIKEIHHRVKNNLAVISGLLEIQGLKIEDDEVHKFISESLMRVQSIAYVHERLYDTESFTKIANITFINSLLDNIRDRFHPQKAEITIEKFIEEFVIDINQAVPLALLLNEMVVNAFTHAFREQVEGTIYIGMYRENDDIHLFVKDDGEGLPADFSLETDSLGCALIRILTNQLKGEITYESRGGDGAKFHLRFPEKIFKGSSSSLSLAG